MLYIFFHYLFKLFINYFLQKNIKLNDIKLLRNNFIFKNFQLKLYKNINMYIYF